MNLFKQLVKKYLTHFSYFYIHLRYRLFIALGLSIAVGVLDGFGLAMFLPLLEMVDGKAEASAEGLGNLSFLVEGMQSLGLSLNLRTVLLAMLFFFSLKGVAKFVESYYKVIVQQFFIKRLRLDNINKLSNYRYKAFVMADSGRIQNTLSGETERVVNAYRSYFMTVQMAVMLTVYIVLAFLANPQFAVLVTLGGLFSNLAFRQIYKRTKATSKKITADSHGYQGLLIQKVAFFKYLKATALNQRYTDKLKKTVTQIEKNNKKIGFYNSLLEATREPLVLLVVVTVIMVQVTYFSESLGLIILSLLFFYRSLTFLMTLQTYWNSFLNVSGSLENMTAFQKELRKDQERYGKKSIDQFSNSIRIKDLSFSYGQTPILKDISLVIPKNKTIAFVGESGSGKTTLVNLITGLMSPDSGNILIDDINTAEADIRTFQSRIGYITQEPVIFNDTIFNNVTFWDTPTASNLRRFRETLEKAAIVDFVRKLPLGENTLLGSNGINISGGQKQRLSIARELYKDIDILVMDEATSALDSETEKAIQENMDRLQGKYTVLIVAHRLSTIKNADQVVLMNKGKIETVGSYIDLIEISSSFRKMVELQEL